MRKGKFWLALQERDRALLSRIFENRVMSVQQIGTECFSGLTRQAISRRLVKLAEYSYLERRFIHDFLGRPISIFFNAPLAIREVKKSYPYRITSDLCKSDSIEHDLQLVEIRKRIQSMACVTRYLTENVLQACEEFLRLERVEPFVRMNTDAILEIDKNGKKVIVGLEFENSEKAQERYTRKLLGYYAEPRVPIVLYIGVNSRIIETISHVESQIVAANRPKCFFALAEDVLRSNGNCTFVNLKGDKITL